MCNKFATIVVVSGWGLDSSVMLDSKTLGRGYRVGEEI